MGSAGILTIDILLFYFEFWFWYKGIFLSLILKIEINIEFLTNCKIQSKVHELNLFMKMKIEFVKTENKY
jgi:hypothetical protein